MKAAWSSRMFDGDRARCELEEALNEAGCAFESIGFDEYDNSLELYKVPSDYRLSEEARAIIRDAGFSVVYINHVDTWETHYSLLDMQKPGWRVSYPHKRNDSDSTIGVEHARPSTWPESFNVTVK